MNYTNENVIMHNGKEYRCIEDENYWGYSLDHCIKELQKKAIMFKDSLWYLKFNSYILYSDEVTLDSAYKEVLGKTYGEFIDERNKKAIEAELKKKEYETASPELIEQYKKTGKKILDKKYYKNYEEMIPLSLKGTYKGWELTQALEIINMLNEGKSFEDCNAKMAWQSHSGFSFGLTVRIISELCERGPEFQKYINEKYYNQ